MMSRQPWYVWALAIGAFVASAYLGMTLLVPELWFLATGQRPW